MSGDWTPIKKLEGIGLGFIRNGWLLKNKRSNQHVITTLVRQIPNLWDGCRAFFFFPTRRLRWKVHRRPRVRRASVRRRPRRAHTHAKPRAGAFCSCWWQQNYLHLCSSVLLVASNTARDPAWWTETRTQQTPGGGRWVTGYMASTGSYLGLVCLIWQDLPGSVLWLNVQITQWDPGESQWDCHTRCWGIQVAT